MNLLSVLNTAALLSLLTMASGAVGGASQVILEAQDSVGAQLPKRSPLPANVKPLWVLVLMKRSLQRLT